MVESLCSQIELGDVSQARRKLSEGTDSEIFGYDEPDRVQVNGSLGGRPQINRDLARRLFQARARAPLPSPETFETWLKDEIKQAWND
jgi:hypothetical protein